MIGIIAQPQEHELVGEFFELFKTPWEFYRPDGRYRVVVIMGDGPPAQAISADMMVIYAGRPISLDESRQTEVVSEHKAGTIAYRDTIVPLYGSYVTIRGTGIAMLTDVSSKRATGLLDRSGAKVVVRIGYDLFREMETVMTDGQPVEHAGVPTVELHIAILRDAIVEAGIPLVEIPPIPNGHTCIASLTHDVDHPSIRRHCGDRTMFGFLYRAVVGSIRDVCTRRLPVSGLLVNWAAVARLPFVYLGLAKDFWYEFGRYLEIEQSLDSTFFVLPYAAKPGRTETGTAPKIRAAGYGAADIADRLKELVGAGREIGLHGIDAWLDEKAGRDEMAQIISATGVKQVGVRMHWLYFSPHSPQVLEAAGFAYDTTVGFNETVGYRAGTTQVYKPLKAIRLLELPLHVMDTALFYSGYLHLTAEAAEERLGSMIDVVLKFGGALTINWHDRSLAPERLWGESYLWLINRLKRSGAWCTSAGRTIAWFQNRRRVIFRQLERGIEITAQKAEGATRDDLPDLLVRSYNVGTSERPYVDSVLKGTVKLDITDRRSAFCHS